MPQVRDLLDGKSLLVRQVGRRRMRVAVSDDRIREPRRASRELETRRREPFGRHARGGGGVDLEQ
jgi:hypothetical protein